MSLLKRLESIEHRVNLLEQENRRLHAENERLSDLSKRMTEMERGVAILIGHITKAHWTHPLMMAARKGEPIRFRFNVNIKTNEVTATMLPKDTPEGADAQILSFTPKQDPEPTPSDPEPSA